MDITQTIKDAFDVISLMLVFVFVLFDIRYPQIIRDLEKQIPISERKQERENHKRHLRRSLWFNNVPLIVVNGILLYLLLPLLVSVVQSSTVALWRFDFAKTSFVVVFLFVLVFFLWSVILGLKLLKRIAESS